MPARLATARPGSHVDVSLGDPITPAPRTKHLPRILGSEIVIRGYPLAMVHTEKIVTAISRGNHEHPVVGFRRHVPARQALCR